MDDSSETPQATIALWKDIWWIKGIVLSLFGVSCFLTFKVLVAILKFLGSGKRRYEDNISTILPNVTSDGNVETIKFQQNSPMKQSGDLSLVNPKIILEESDADQFYDLAHHGIKFYDDNVFSGTRMRRQRMHSTVAETTLVSMVRQRQRPGPTVMNPPAFPKLDDSLDNNSVNSSNEFKTGSDGHFSSGDMRFYTQTQLRTNNSRLAPVAEEDASEFNLETESTNKAGPVDQQKEDTLYQTSKRHIPRNINKQAMNSSTCDNACCIKECAGNVTATSCPSLVVDKHPQDLPMPSMVKCSICESRIRCLCKNCSNLCFPRSDDKEYSPAFNTTTDDEDMNHPEGFPEIEDHFIDENFEDMESIVSDEIIIDSIADT